MAQADGLGQRLVEAEVYRERPSDLGDLERVGEPGDKVVPIGIDEHLGLVLETTERLGVEDAIPVALEGGSVVIRGFGDEATPASRRPRCGRRQPLPFPQLRLFPGAANEPAHTIRSRIRADTKSRVPTTMAIASIWTAAARYKSRLMFCWRRNPMPPPPANPMIVDMRTLMSHRESGNAME